MIIAKIVLLLVLFAAIGQPSLGQGIEAPNAYGLIHSYYDTSDLARQILGEVEGNHLQKAVDRMLAKEWGWAIDECDFILDYFPDHPQALHILGQAAIATRHLDPAEYRFQQAMYFYPSSATTYAAYGTFKYELGDHAAAIDAYRMAIELSPTYAEAHYNLGLVYVAKGEYDQANVHGQLAYSLNYPLPGLRNSLERLRAWQPLPEDELARLLTQND